MNKDKIYYVEWHDAHSASGWHYESDVKKFIEKSKCVVITIGWILNETKDEIVMASRKMKWPKDGDTEWGMLQKIPKAWIRKKIIFKENKS